MTASLLYVVINIIFILIYGLVGLVVKASTLRVEDRFSNPACDGIFPGWVIPMT